MPVLASANGQKLFPGTANMRPADEKQKQVHTYGKRWSKAVAPQQTVPLAHKHKKKKGGGGGFPPSYSVHTFRWNLINICCPSWRALERGETQAASRLLTSTAI